MADVSAPMNGIRHIICAVIILMLLPARPAEAVLVLKRGVNFEAWQRWTNKGDFQAPWYDRSNFPDWSKLVNDRQLTALRAQGFDFVRLNIDPSPFLWSMEFDELVNSMLASVRRIRAAGLKVIVDLHTIPNMDDRPEGLHYILGTGKEPSPEGFERYKSLVRTVARALVKMPSSEVGLELVNEPNQDWDSLSVPVDIWPRQLQELYLSARTEAPGLTLILTGARGGGIDGLLRLDPAFSADDPDTIWSFHYYDPFVVSHSGLPWERNALHFLQHVPFPASRIDPGVRQRLLQAAQARIEREVPGQEERSEIADKVEKLLGEYITNGWSEATVRTAFGRVKSWSEKHGIGPQRILLGEFGVFQDSADPEARAALLLAVRTAAENLGFCWAVYTAGLTNGPGSFSILDGTGTMAVDSGAARALGVGARQ
ncbi:MAG: cellulase family glycosylhydrolase [Rhodomicrobium sp.]